MSVKHIITKSIAALSITASVSALADYNSPIFITQDVNGNVEGIPGLPNTIIISAGIISGNVVGEYLYPILEDSGAEIVGNNSNGNSIIVNGGTINGDIYGAHVNSFSTASSNTITINGGVINGGIIGGIGGQAINNAIILADNTQINGNLIGGLALNGIASGNQISLGENVIINGTMSGGLTDSSITFNGHGVTANAVQQFQIFNFNINPLAANTTVLSVFDFPVDMQGATINVSINDDIKVGDRFTLINHVTNAQNQNFTFSQGLSSQLIGQILTPDIDTTLWSNPGPFDYSYTLELLIGSAILNPQTKSASEGRIAGIAMVNQGVDMAASTAQALGHGWTTGAVQGFINTGGSSVRYKSGSHVDLDGTSLIAGIATRTEFGVLGGFFEAGEGNYGSVNTFTNAPSVKGSGHTRYTGVGVLGRYDFSDNLHLDGTLSTGRSRLNYSSKNWCDNQGQCADYSNSAGYSSTSLTLGYDMPVTGATSVNLRSSMNWTHMNGASTHIGGDPYTFAGTDSKRWINGIRISHDLLEHLTVYGGMAYEYEFDGKTEGSALGMKLDAPTLKGSTTIAEAGIRASHKIDNDVLTLDFGLQGFDGQRSGFGGQLRVGYAY